MADFGSPIAQDVNVSPEKGFETIGSLIGLQSKQLGLQGQAADVQQKQQDAQQRAALAKVDWLKYQGQDGTLDVNAVSSDPDLRKAAGDFYPDILEKAAKIKSAQVGAKQSLLGLNSDTVGKFASTAAGVANDPDVQADNPAGRQKVSNAFNEYAQTYGPDAQHIVGIYGPSVQHAPQGKLAGALQSLQLQSLDAQRQIDETKPTTATVDKGGQIQPGAVASPLSATPGAFTPQGRPITKTTPPAIVTTPAGPLATVAAGGQSMSPIATGGAPNLNVNRGQAAAMTGMGEDDKSRYSQIAEAGTTAQKGIALADQVSNLADQVRTGKLTKEWSDRLAVFQQNNPTVTARQMLGKYAAQLQTTALSGAPTDWARSQIEAGMPNPETMDPEAIKQASQFMRGNFRLNQARSTVADKYVKEHGNDVTGLRDVDNQFMQHADPFVFAYKDLPPGDSKKQFLAQHFGDGTKVTNPEGVKQLIANKRIVEHYAGPDQ